MPAYSLVAAKGKCYANKVFEVIFYLLVYFPWYFRLNRNWISHMLKINHMAKPGLCNCLAAHGRSEVKFPYLFCLTV